MIVQHVPDKKEMEMQGIAIELHIDCNCINICQNIQSYIILIKIGCCNAVKYYYADFFGPKSILFYLSPLLSEVGAKDNFIRKKKIK